MKAANRATLADGPVLFLQRLSATAPLIVKDGSICCICKVAPEQKARAAYEHIMNQTDCEQYLAPLRFLREREVVHFQRFSECWNILKEIFPDGKQNRPR